MANSRVKKKASTAAFKGAYFVAEDRHDPVIDAVQTLVNDSGQNLSRISTGANIARGTLDKWLDGTTREPRHSKIASVLATLGYTFQIVPNEHRPGAHSVKASQPRIIYRKVTSTTSRRPSADRENRVGA